VDGKFLERNSFDNVPAIEIYKWILIGMKRNKRRDAEMERLREEAKENNGTT
jgi:hypothetical protein